MNIMFRRLRWVLGRNFSAKRLTHGSQQTAPQAADSGHVVRLDTVQEVSVFIHRFHNLDLFHQGWYQIKVTVRWENGEDSTPGTPARVVQYEAPDLGSEDMSGGWIIDDTENSFLTPPCRIRYARQDVHLAIMISFNLSLGNVEKLSKSAVILKFELLYAPLSTNRSEMQQSLEACLDAVHEFRIPPKALLGLHSYCPVHFDPFHAVLIDTTIHVGLLKAGSRMMPTRKVSRAMEDFTCEEAGQSQVVSIESKEVMLLKALVASRDIILEVLQKISEAIGESIDLADFMSKLEITRFHPSIMQPNFASYTLCSQPSGSLQNVVEVNTSSQVDISNSIDLLGNQILYLWSTFLKLHRANRTKILKYLHDMWASDRRAEWSIWMVYSRVEMPRHSVNGVVSDVSYLGSHGRPENSRKLNVDPAQKAAFRAELHRRSIAQMRINNRSIQDMQLFGDPLRNPIVFVEHVTNVPLNTTSVNSYLSLVKQKDLASSLCLTGAKAPKELPEAMPGQNDRILKVVVFVHGFQGHHLDLRLIRNQWLLIDPKIEILMSEVNEDKTSEDFREMGLRLAQEVIGFVKKKMDKVSRIGNLRDIKLSFVGHSIGNIIIRAALAESIMEPYLRFLYTFVSISGPHLGYLYSSNSLFNSGLWLLKKLKGTQCIHQLTFSDDPDLENTFLYELCKQKTLQDFRNIILLSSPQDGYIPYHSARIQLCPGALEDYSRKGKLFVDMLNNCLSQINAPSSECRVFMRCDVNFNTSAQGRNLNTIIGRAAHIEFLESDIFAKFIMWSFPELFR